MFKRRFAFILALITVLAGAFSFSSCGLGKDDSKIYVVREEVFKDAVKLDDGVIEKVLLKKLEDADEQNLITGKKYYAIAYADNKKISHGFFKFFNEVKIESGDFVESPKGYHPMTVAPGYKNYCLWIMAGKERGLLSASEECHKWVVSK